MLPLQMLPQSENVSQLGWFYDAVLQYPLYAILAILFGFLILWISSRVLYSIITTQPSDNFVSVLSSSSLVTIVMHDNPDPDAMASAMAVKHLATAVGADTEIVYPGRISHAENRAFRAVLNVDFRRITQAGEIDGDTIVLVDASEPRGFINGESIVPDAIIDHHPMPANSDPETSFVHINTAAGSCSSILTQFLVEQVQSSDTIPETLATALYYGIQTDTKDFSQGVEEIDFDAMTRLYSLVDGDKINRIANPQVDGETLEARARAIIGRDVRGPFAVSDVGDVMNPDAIPQAADELVQLEGVSAAVVFGTYEDTIRFSGRAYDDRIHIGSSLERTLSELSENGSAGGHARMAGGQLPVKTIQQNDISRSIITEQLFTVLNGRQPTISSDTA